MSEIDSALGLSWVEGWLTVAVAAGVYLAVVVLSRIFGPRQFSATSSYDLAFVFALGGLIGRVILVRTSLAGAVVGLSTMFVLHATSRWLHHRSSLVHRISENRAIVLVAHGRALDEQLKTANTTLLELHEQLRLQGRASLDGVRAVILERNGRLSVIDEDATFDRGFFRDVQGVHHLVGAGRSG